MSHIVVIGGGFSGLAAAARLAKLGHQITLIERSPQVGGAVSRHRATVPGIDGEFGWDNGPSATVLPAVIRDLFRKSGRPVERELDLVHREILREHHFEDRSVVALPGSTRAGAITAFDTIKPGMGEQWVQYVDSFADAWGLLRTEVFERPFSAAHSPADVGALLASRTTVRRHIKSTLRDPRLRIAATWTTSSQGHQPRSTPWWAGVTAYLEQTFGLWETPTLMADLSDAMADRLGVRGVTVLTSTTATDLVIRDQRVVAVTVTEQSSAAQEIDCDLVVCAIDPRLLPALRRHVRHTLPAFPPIVAHVGLDAAVLATAVEAGKLTVPTVGEVVLHGEPTVTIRTTGSAPEGHLAWTFLGRGRVSEDLLIAAARRGFDVRKAVVVRDDRSALTQTTLWGSSPMGVEWQGRGTVTDRLGPTTPIPGVYAVGAHATSGSGLPFVGLTSSVVSQLIGPADS